MDGLIKNYVRVCGSFLANVCLRLLRVDPPLLLIGHLDALFVRATEGNKNLGNEVLIYD